MPPGCQSRTIHVFLVHDDVEHAHLARAALSAALRGVFDGVNFGVYDDPVAALAALPAEGPCVVLCDYRLANKTALDWLDQFTSRDVGPFLVMTASGHEDIAANVFRGVASDYINRSVLYGDRERLRHIIVEALRRYELERTTRELTDQLRIANEDLRTKSELLASMSDAGHRFVEDVAHEFRTPLAVIQEFASIMADGIGGEVSEKHGEFLDFIANATRDLSLLVDDFLDSGKLRAGTLRLDRRSYHPQDVLDSCWSLLEARAEARGIALERWCPSSAPHVFLDLDKAKRTLMNLVVGAIKVSPPGSKIVVRVATRGDDLVCFQVHDNATTLPEDQYERLRDFFKDDRAIATRDHRGFGLGLSIVRELTRVNLGTVSVGRAEGGGNCFSFTVPIDRIESVVGRYLAWISTMGKASMLSVLRIREPSEGESSEALEAFLGSMSRASDLRLPSPDGDGFVMVGVGYRPQEWQARMQAWYAESALPGSVPGDGRLCIEVLGTRSVPEAYAFLVEQMAPSVEV